MGSIYRRRVNGKRTPNWTIQFQTPSGRVCRLAAFRDKRASQELLDTIDGLLACKGSGSRPDAALLRRVERLPFGKLDKLREWGVLDARYSAAVKPLTAHVDDWERSLVSSGRSVSHVSGSIGAVREVLRALGWTFWGDVSPAGLETYLAGLRREGRECKSGKRRTISVRRSNAIQGAVQQFARWVVREGRAAENPLVRLKPLNVETDRKHVRRAFRLDELRSLIAAAESGGEVYGMQGAERALLYRFAAETGLRAGELRALTKSCLDLEQNTVRVEAATAKNRRADVLPIRPETAQALSEALSHKSPAALVFNLPARTRMASMIRRDMESAGVQRLDDSGRVLDFHSLRSTCATLLAHAGVPLTTAQAILRHSDPRLTAKVYTTRFRETEAEAVERLPSFDVEPRQARSG